MSFGSCGQSYKFSLIVIYNSRVVTTRNFLGRVIVYDHGVRR